jgi:hypothetical protein
VLGQRYASDLTDAEWALSRSNWAKDNSTLSVSRPIELVVLNCWVTDTNEICREDQVCMTRRWREMDSNLRSRRRELARNARRQLFARPQPEYPAELALLGEPVPRQESGHEQLC